MKKVGRNEITYHQFITIIIGSMLGIGILPLPGRLTELAHQDGWISALVGVLYPLYIGFMAVYISKKFPDDNILSISKKCFGKFIGSLLNLMFSIQFFIYMALAAAGFTNVIRLYIVEFLSRIKITIIILLIALYGTFLGLKIIGRINEIIFFLIIALMFFPLIALKDGSLLNVSPFFGSGIKNILKASIESGFAYGGAEIIFLIYPNMGDKNKLKSGVLKGIWIIAFFYTYLTFLTIYYAGPDIVSKPYWPLMILNEALNLPFINSFRFIFMYLWSIDLFKSIMNHYYGFTYSISNSFLKLKTEKVCFIVFPFALYVVNKYGNETIRRQIATKLIPYITVFNLIFITLTAIMIHFKKGESNESS